MTLVDPKPVVLEIARPAKSPSSDEDEIIIINQGYPTEQDEITINDEVYNVSGMMRVTKDGSVYAGNSTDDPRDLSYRFNQYHLNIPNQDRAMVQPNAIVLESQLLQHHFVHWNVPSREVRCQLYTVDGGLPSIDISNSQDQQFVWIIPTEKSNQLALQTYGKHYYLAFTPADLKATLHEGDLTTNNRLRINPVPDL